jgi:hypothetical protein
MITAHLNNVNATTVRWSVYNNETGVDDDDSASKETATTSRLIQWDALDDSNGPVLRYQIQYRDTKKKGVGE